MNIQDAKEGMHVVYYPSEREASNHQRCQIAKVSGSRILVILPDGSTKKVRPRQLEDKQLELL